MGRSRFSTMLDDPPPADVETHGRLKWKFYDFEGPQGTRPAIVLWRGKSKRPKRTYFRTTEHRQRFLGDLKDNDDRTTAYKAEQKTKAAALLTEIDAKMQVGAVLHYSWGYEQTQCEYFQVVARKGKCTVIIRAIGALDVPGSAGFMSCRYRPAPGRFLKASPEITKRLGPYGLRMDHGTATPTTPDETHYCSWYG